jgi:hypothetical protein
MLGEKKECQVLNGCCFDRFGHTLFAVSSLRPGEQRLPIEIEFDSVNEPVCWLGGSFRNT